MVDGGSTDGTSEVARSFGAQVIEGGYRDNSEPRRAIGLLQAKNEIIYHIESDVFLSTHNWLREMIEPSVKNHDIVATRSLRYKYRRDDYLLN